MKRNDLAVLLVIVTFVGGLAYFVGQQFIGSKALKPVEVETARPISSEVQRPSSEIFNSNAINPTVKITIGENNQTPIGN